MWSEVGALFVRAGRSRMERTLLLSVRKNVIPEKTTVKYEKNAEVQYLAVDISLIHENNFQKQNKCHDFNHHSVKGRL